MVNKGGKEEESNTGLDNAPQNLLLFALEDGAGRSLLTGSKQFYLD